MFVFTVLFDDGISKRTYLPEHHQQRETGWFQIFDEKAHKVVTELENRLSPINQMAGTEMLAYLNKIWLKNANKNPLQMIDQIKNLKITYSNQNKKLTEEAIVDHI